MVARRVGEDAELLHEDVAVVLSLKLPMSSMPRWLITSTLMLLLVPPMLRMLLLLMVQLQQALMIPVWMRYLKRSRQAFGGKGKEEGVDTRGHRGGVIKIDCVFDDNRREGDGSCTLIRTALATVSFLVLS